jgi:starch phosphorylase
MIIRLICHVSDIINRDTATNRTLKAVFLPNYRVSIAEVIYPGADVSEQISTAGYEASGTSNMKFALNGALTVGTLDGANVEIMEEVGRENIFIFGLTTEEVCALRPGYRPLDYYAANPVIKQTLDLIRSGFFSPDEPDLFRPLVDLLLNDDRYMVLADFDSYHRAQMQIDELYCDTDEWTRRSILNVARIGKFSSDRTILEYNRDIWHAEPVPIERPAAETHKPGAAAARSDSVPRPKLL